MSEVVKGKGFVADPPVFYRECSFVQREYSQQGEDLFGCHHCGATGLCKVRGTCGVSTAMLPLETFADRLVMVPTVLR